MEYGSAKLSSEMLDLLWGGFIYIYIYIYIKNEVVKLDFMVFG